MKNPIVETIIHRFAQSDSEIVNGVVSLLRYSDFDDMASKVIKLVQAQDAQKCEIIQVENWNLFPESEITVELLELVKEKAQANCESTTFRSVYANTSSYEAKIKQLKIRVRIDANETITKSPDSPDEWRIILRGLQLRLDLVDFHKSLPNDLRRSNGCFEDKISIRDDFASLLATTRRDFFGLSKDVQHKLLEAFDNVRCRQKLYAEHSKLLFKHQTLKQELSEAVLALKQAECTTERELGKLNTLNVFASHMKTGDTKCAKTKSKEGSIRRSKNFEDSFRECLSGAPFVLMTTGTSFKFLTSRFVILMINDP